MVLTMSRGKFQRHLVEVIRPDGNGVSVEVTNGATDPYVAQRRTTPLTTGQLIALVTDPMLATKVTPGSSSTSDWQQTG
jgi:hypothetical protein